MRAASAEVTPDDLLSAWIDPDRVPHILARVIVATAPHIAAGELADLADELHPVEEPLHVRARGSVRWGLWDQARMLRERAWRVLNWKPEPDTVELVPAPRVAGDLIDCDFPTMPLSIARGGLVAS